MVLLLCTLFLFAKSAFATLCPKFACTNDLVSARQLGNGACDSYCMNAPCGFDANGGDSDCLAACELTGCVASSLGDSNCDSSKRLARLQLPDDRCCLPPSLRKRL